MVLRVHDLCRLDAAAHVGYVAENGTACVGFADAGRFRADYSLFYYFLFWFVWLATSLTFIIVHGIEYVNWPRLLPLSDIVFYDGPGFRSGNHGKGFGIPPLDPVRDEKAYAGRRRAGSRLGEVEMGEKRRVD